MENTIGSNIQKLLGNLFLPSAKSGGHNHINGIKGFWSFAKERFHKYHGIHKKNYPLYVKEMEFRFNHKNEDLYPILVEVPDFTFCKIGTVFLRKTSI